MSNENVYGVQVYSTRELVPVELEAQLVHSPYVSEVSTDALIAMGVVFFRDSEHAQGAFAEQFNGRGFYTQLFADEKTGKIGNVVMLNQPCKIAWVQADGVNREMEP